MRVCTWNMHNATAAKVSRWEYLSELRPDIALLQEVNSIPESIQNAFTCLYRKAVNKTGKPQNFGTAVLVKGQIKNPIDLLSEWDWVTRELAIFNGNLLAAEVILDSGSDFNVISVHSPHWPIDPNRLIGEDISEVADGDPEVFGTELLWATLRFHLPISNKPWLVGGDFNSSVTLDTGRSHGNQVVLNRMYDLNLTECLFHSKGKLTPTFKNRLSDNQVIHQIDHLFMSNILLSKLKSCNVGDESRVFEEPLSDHLPIIADFDL